MAPKRAFMGISGLRRPLVGWAMALSLPVVSLLAQAEPAESAEPLHEAPVWSGRYQGQIAGKAVRLDLWRLDGALGGSYCYEPCDRPGAMIDLQGRAASGQLTETPMAGPGEAKPSGRWQLGALPGMAPQRLQGRWQSMDGKRRWAIDLQQKPTGFAQPPRHELRLMMGQRIQTLADCGSTDLGVSAIRVYEQGRLKQTLETASFGSCWLVQPSWVDANFDGWPDLTQAQEQSAGPNTPTRSWLYDPAKKKFVLGPQELQDIPSPAFDAQAQRIYSDWRASCCSHGVDIFAWKSGKLKRVERAESYVLPVRKSGQLMGCYIMPQYRGGHVVWPDALYRNADGLAMGKAPAADWCDLEVRSSMHQAQLQVLAPQKAGEKASVQAAYGMSYVTVETRQGPRYCPDLAVFDADERKVVRIQLTDNPIENCQVEK